MLSVLFGKKSPNGKTQTTKIESDKVNAFIGSILLGNVYTESARQTPPELAKMLDALQFDFVIVEDDTYTVKAGKSHLIARINLANQLQTLISKFGTAEPDYSKSVKPNAEIGKRGRKAETLPTELTLIF